jgi:molybdenum cofactor synthesis domain-containing protein
MIKLRVGVLTVSDKGFRGERVDEGGPLIMKLVRENLDVADIIYKIVPDEMDMIENTLREWSNSNVDLIVTTGGTGPSPRDVTPEATMKIIEKRFYGLEILMLLEGLKKTPEAVYSRAVVGSKGGTLIINLPGNPKAIMENFPPLFPLIPHLIFELKGLKGDHSNEGDRGSRV